MTGPWKIILTYFILMFTAISLYTLSVTKHNASNEMQHVLHRTTMFNVWTVKSLGSWLIGYMLALFPIANICLLWDDIWDALLMVIVCHYWAYCHLVYRKISNISGPNPKTEMFLVSACSCLCAIYWSQVLSGAWRCNWSTAPTGDAPTASEWSIILLPIKARLILETWCNTSHESTILYLHNLTWWLC